MAWHFPWTVFDSFNNIKSNLSDGYHFGDVTAGWYGFDRNYVEPVEPDALEKLMGNETTILGEASDEKTVQQLLKEDREHTEEREDTAFQRAVADMRAAGLNPYTVGSSSSPSSASTVGESLINNRLQMLGYLLDVKNLDLKNKSFINNVVNGIIKAVS